MEGFFTDILIILSLILLNGFFSGSEIAIISVRDSELESLIEAGNKRASIIRKLRADPDTFFATVQIGVTLVGTFASVFGGARLVRHVAPLLEAVPVPLLADFSYEISLGALVLGISYTSLVFGELVPKSFAYANAKAYAMTVAYPLGFFARVFYAFTRLLTSTSNLVLWPFKDSTSFSETRFSDDELLHLLQEGVKEGSIESNEQVMIQNVLEINDTNAREVMVPRVDIQAVPVDAGEEDIRRILELNHSRLPVFNKNMDNIIGILHVKDLIRYLSRRENLPSLSELVRPTYYVPESMKIGGILSEMQKRKTHMAVVVDEFGGTAGLLTLEDILEEIVGEIQEVTEVTDETQIFPLPDGNHIVVGSCPISEFNEFFELDLPESDSYTSIAGYVIEQAGRFPEVGERIETGPVAFELIKKVRQKLVSFRVYRIVAPEVEPPPES
jgi:putative hemolysin